MISQQESRVKSFVNKFQVAATALKAPSYRDIESLKFRGSTGSQDYRDLLNELVLSKVKEIKGDYQGQAWKLTDTNNNSIIIVEHETGLEILYIAGSVASIVGLIPLVTNLWSRRRDHWQAYRGRFGAEGLERRHFDINDHLIEEPAPPVGTIILQHLLNQQDKLNARISTLETEVSVLKSLIGNPPLSTAKKKNAKS